MRWNIIVECVGEDGQRSTITLGTIERLAASTTAENLGVNLRESKQIANRLQDTVVKHPLYSTARLRTWPRDGRLFPANRYHSAPVLTRGGRSRVEHEDDCRPE